MTDRVSRPTPDPAAERAERFEHRRPEHDQRTHGVRVTDRKHARELSTAALPDQHDALAAAFSQAPKTDLEAADRSLCAIDVKPHPGRRRPRRAGRAVRARA